MKLYDDIGVLVPTVYLPRPGSDLASWSVVACDQYTSQPEYWQQVERQIGEKPSTLNLILPEVYLGKSGEKERVQIAQSSMNAYLEEGVLEPFEGMIYIERKLGSKTRRGLVMALDLECYDFNKGSQSLIRATEGTILDRLPPRMRIREGAALELPHILVLIDDPGRTVIEQVELAKEKLSLRYDFDLMMDSGHLTGYLVDDPAVEMGVIEALRKLADPQSFAKKYNVGPEEKVLLFAMGDGNHSLATAKAIWEKLKPEVGMDHPARYALVEIENLHDPALEFEPIHRVLFGVKTDVFSVLQETFGDSFSFIPCTDCTQMISLVDGASVGRQRFGATWNHEFGVVEISNPTSNVAAGTLQNFLDDFLKAALADSIDYVHGNCTVCKLTSTPGTFGFFLPCLEKNELFRTVILDGALPRKTFSMGEAWEKRFYMEARKIV